MAYLLVLLLLIPLVGAVVCAMLPGARLARTYALLVALATLAVAVILGIQMGREGFESFRVGSPTGAFAIRSIGFSLTLGIDAISYWLVLLTALLTPLAIWASFDSIQTRQKEYYAWMLALHVAMLGVFLARDVLLFYVFFELTLVPMFFIIGIWGGPERRYAANKFFLFTFAGSVFTLAAAIYLGLKAGSFDFDRCIPFAQHNMSQVERWWLALGFLAGFAVKVPLFPVHTWLPLAHTEAPTAGSVILAGVLLKLGTYGLLRLTVPIGLVGADFDQVIYSGHFIPFVKWLPFAFSFGGLIKFLGVMCVVGVIYGALVAWVQQDIKKLVAYSSVSHLGFCVLGLIALNDHGMQGSILYMINHGLSTGAMFLVIGMIYDRYHTRDINQLSGLARKMPKLAFFFVLFVLSSIGLPGLNGFWSEFLTILGAFTSPHLGITFGVFAATGIVLGAVYMLHMTARVIFGPLKVPALHDHGHGAAAHGTAATTHGAVRVYDAGAAATTTGQTAHGVAHGQADQGQGADPGGSHGHGAGHDGPGDINFREISILVPLAVLVVVLGVAPNILTRPMGPEVTAIRTVQPLAPLPPPEPIRGPATPRNPFMAPPPPAVAQPAGVRPGPGAVEEPGR